MAPAYRLRCCWTSAAITQAEAAYEGDVPTYDEGAKLPANAARFREIQRKTNELLQLE